MNKDSSKILFFLNHPAHFHLFKHVISSLKQKGYGILIYIVTKDVLEELVKKERWDYVNLFPEGRRNPDWPHIVSVGYFMFKTWARLWRRIREDKPRLMVGSERTITHIGCVTGIRSLYVCEDDTRATKENYITYPFATKVLLPECVDRGLWMKKKMTYRGYHELAYLHPRYFTPDAETVKKFNPGMKRYFLLRLVEFSASHDAGKGGINDALLKELIARLTPHGKVYISSERPLKEEFESYRLNIDPRDVFDVMAFADLYIGDSQTMTLESAVLGTPAIRFNDFVGIHSVFDELQNDYGLLFDIHPSEPQKLFETIDGILREPDIKNQWREKRDKMLSEKEDVVHFLINSILEYV